MIRFYLIGGSVLALALAVASCQHEKDQRQKAEVRAAAAAAQAALTTKAADAVEAAQTRSFNITVQANEAAHEVATTPDGMADVPPAVVDLWSDSIDRLRDEAAAARDPGGEGAARAVPKAAQTGASNGG